MKNYNMYTNSEISMLEQASSKLCTSLLNHNEYEMRVALNYVFVNLPFVVDQGLKNTFQIMKEQGMLEIEKRSSVEDISRESLPNNIHGYLLAVNSTLQDIYPKVFTQKSTMAIYYPIQPLKPTDVIHNSEGQELKVSDLLSIAGYAIKIVEAISPNERTEEASAAITVFKSMDLALRNQQQDKPLSKALHLANDFLTTVVKSNIKKDEGKPDIIITSILIDVAIDFLVNK